MTTDGLEIYRPDGRKFLSSVELEREREQERQQADLAENQLGRLRAQLSTLSPEQLKALGLDPGLLG